jgi:transposase-like protein
MPKRLIRWRELLNLPCSRCDAAEAVKLHLGERRGCCSRARFQCTQCGYERMRWIVQSMLKSTGRWQRRRAVVRT